MQCTPPNWYRSVYYASQRLSTAEKNYSTTEREALGMVNNINKFRHYLLGRKFTFHVDHSGLLYLLNKQALTGRLARWMLLLQEFDFRIQHLPGVQHAVADYLSRLKSGEPEEPTYDDLPDAGLFNLTTMPDDKDDEWTMRLVPTIGTTDGTSSDATSTHSSAGPISKMGFGFCRPFQATRGPYRE